MWQKKKLGFFAGLMFVALVWGPGGALALKVGQRAPEFKLPATTGKHISLSQFRGKKMVLVEFYVADFGPT